MKKFIPLSFLTIALLFGALPPAFPEEGRSPQGYQVSIDDAVERAFTHDERLSLIEMRIHEEESLKRSAEKFYWPKVKTSLYSAVSTERNPGVWFWTNDLILPLYDGGRKRSEARLHGLRKEAHVLGRKSIRANLKYEIETIYIRTLSEKELVRLAQGWVKEAGKLNRSFEKLYETGIVTKQEYYHARNLYGTSRKALIEHKTALDYGENLLRELLALPRGARLLLEELPRIRRISFIENDFSENPIYENLKLKIKEKEEETRAARSDYFPKISLLNRYRIAKDSFLDQNRFEFGVEGSWNVWDFGETRELVRAKEFEQKESELQAKIEAKEFEREIRRLLGELKKVFFLVRSEKANLLEMTEAYQNDKTKLITGEFGRFELFDSFTAVTRAQESYVSALANYRILQASLIRLKEGSAN